jgi:DNA-binding winged helix-turn-helix (wHTH) protein/tetratricopeptide (TPR) repeat protein
VAAEAQAEWIRVLDLLIDAASGTVTRDGERLPLPPKTFELLLALARRAPGVVRRHELLEAVWSDEHVTEQTLSRRVFVLRHALGDDAEHPRYVAGERGWGYRLVAPVERLASPPPGGRGRRRRAPAGLAAAAVLAAALLAVLRPSCGSGDSFPRPPVVRVSALSAEAGDAGVDWLATHLTRAVRERLRRQPGVRTVSEAGRGIPDLDLEGTLEREDGGIRVRLRLREGATRRVVWARSLAAPARELLLDPGRVADPVALAAADELGLGGAAPADAPDAQRLCLRGLYFWGTWTPEGLRQSRDAFALAASIDPRSGDAAAGESFALLLLALQSASAPGAELRGAREAAARAVRLAPESPLALVAVALLHLLADDDVGAAERAARRAVAAEPDDATALVALALVVQSAGRPAESVPLLLRAGETDPLSACVPLLLGRALVAGGDAARAAVAFGRAVELAPSLPAAWRGLAEARSALGREDEALAAALTAWRLAAPSAAEMLALERAAAAGGLAGLRGRACVSPELERGAPVEVALACAGAGNEARALAVLTRIARERRPLLRLLAQEPALGALREDARVRALLATPASPPSARRPG